MLGVGVIIVAILTVGQWYSVYKDKVSAMMMIGAFMVIIDIILLSVSIWYLGPRTTFNYSNFPCEEMMSVINQNSFASMPDCGTSGKYTVQARSLDLLS